MKLGIAHMKHILTVIVCFLILAAGTGYAWWKCEWPAVSRAGTVMVVAAILFESWRPLLTSNPDNLPFWKSPASQNSARVALLLVCFGTLVQGWGDLVAEVVLSCR